MGPLPRFISSISQWFSGATVAVTFAVGASSLGCAQEAKYPLQNPGGNSIQDPKPDNALGVCLKGYRATNTKDLLNGRKIEHGYNPVCKEPFTKFLDQIREKLDHGVQNITVDEASDLLNLAYDRAYTSADIDGEGLSLVKQSQDLALRLYSSRSLTPEVSRFMEGAMIKIREHYKEQKEVLGKGKPTQHPAQPIPSINRRQSHCPEGYRVIDTSYRHDGRTILTCQSEQKVPLTIPSGETVMDFKIVIVVIDNAVDEGN